MGILSGFLVLSVIGLLLFLLSDDDIYDDGWHLTGCVVLVVGVVFLCISLIMLPLCRLSDLGDIEKYNALKQTLKTARANLDISEFELAALQTEVIKVNKWVANAKFWSNHKLTNWFWHPKIQELEFIK